MNIKNLIKTKTFWGGIASITTGVGLIINDEMQSGLVLIAQGLTAIFLRDAVNKGGR